MRKLAAGNWKMNGTGDDLDEVRALIDACPAPKTTDIVLCAPATLIHRMAEIAMGSCLQVGGQDCHPKAAGAHTGDISAAMLREAGASFVIVGHSERRTDHRETDIMVRAKAMAGLAEWMRVILCLGETLEDRQAGRTLDVVGAQLDGSLPPSFPPEIKPKDALIIAYEPVWAIGTGLTPTNDQIAEVHTFLRGRLVARFAEAGREMRLLYGGSVKPSNAAEIFALPNVDGALVGGASLKAADFSKIVLALDAAPSRD
jgi:triosephosphate isomerase (TIM)